MSFNKGQIFVQSDYDSDLVKKYYDLGWKIDERGFSIASKKIISKIDGIETNIMIRFILT